MQRTSPAPTHVARILVVDRDRDQSRALVGELGRALPLRPEVVEASGCRSALDLLRAGSFDIVVLDLPSVVEPGASPEDGVARLVKLAAGALTVALSPGHSVSVALGAMRAGAHEVITRPVDGATFVSRVGELALRHGRCWTLNAGATTGTAAAMLSEAGAALRAAAEPAKRPTVLPMWQQEQRIIEDAIASFSGNITLAAAALELNPSTIYRKRQAWAEMDGGAKGAA